MRLLGVLREALTEQDPSGLDDTLEFSGFIVSIDRSKKKLIFSPQVSTGNVAPTQLRTMMTMLKQNFKILKIDSLEDEGDAGSGDVDDKTLRGMFEIQVDLREDFEAVVDFIKNEIARDMS